MSKVYTILALICMVAISACSSENSDNLSDVLYVNGVIWTGEAGAADAASFAVKNGTISYVGNGNPPHDMKARQTIDLGSQFIMSGFMDNHVHFFEGEVALNSVDLRDAKTPQDFTQRIVNFVNSRPKDQWVLTGNWDHENWGGELPQKEWIDAGTKDTPVFVVRLDGHMALANSAALNLAGITKDTPTPEAGEIVKDKNGAPTGILKDNAMNLIFAVIPKPSDAEVMQAFRTAQNHALSVGLTHINAVTANPNEVDMVNWMRLAQESGELKLRINAFLPIESWHTSRDLVAKDGTGQGRLRWDYVKGLVDGSLGIDHGLVSYAL